MCGGWEATAATASIIMIQRSRDAMQCNVDDDEATILMNRNGMYRGWNAKSCLSSLIEREKMPSEKERKRERERVQ